VRRCRGEGRHCQRAPLPARPVVRIHGRHRRIGTKKRQTETAYAGSTDLRAEQATAKKIAAWARGHWIIENTVRWTKDVTVDEDASQRRRHTPAVISTLRDLARATLHRASWTNIASGRRAHIQPETVLALHRIPCQTDDQGSPGDPA